MNEEHGEGESNEGGVEDHARKIDHLVISIDSWINEQ